jgi:hypothetical protein
MMVRWLILGMLAGLAQDRILDPQSNPPGSEEAVREAKIIHANIDLLTDQDPKIRQVAQDYLLSKGPRVIPLLEQKLRESKTKDYYDMIRLIELKSVAEIPEVNGEADPALAKFSGLASRIKAPERGTIDQVLLLKLAEAYAHVSRGQLDAAERMLGAIRTLDSKWKYDEWVVELQRYVQRKIVEVRFMKPAAEPKSAVVKIGEPIEIVLRMGNIHDQPIKVVENKPAKAILLAEIRATAYDLNGASVEARNTSTFEMPAEISIEPGKEWSNTIQIETKDFLPKKELYREFVVDLVTTPVLFESAQERGVRRLPFPTVTVKVVPANHIDLAADPVGSLQRCIKEGTDDQVYMCVMLCKGDAARVRAANEQLIPLLDVAEFRVGLEPLFQLLSLLNDAAVERTREAWKRWWESQGKK